MAKGRSKPKTGGKPFVVRSGRIWAHLMDGPAKGNHEAESPMAYLIVTVGQQICYYRRSSDFDHAPSAEGFCETPVARKSPNANYTFQGFLKPDDSLIEVSRHAIQTREKFRAKGRTAFSIESATG